MKKHLTMLIPNLFKPILKKNYKKIYYLSLDVIDYFMGRKNPIPPRSMIFVGDGDYKQIGKEFMGYFIELANVNQTTELRRWLWNWTYGNSVNKLLVSTRRVSGL
jgi:hypothetical protein